MKHLWNEYTLACFSFIMDLVRILIFEELPLFCTYSSYLVVLSFSIIVYGMPVFIFVE